MQIPKEYRRDRALAWLDPMQHPRHPANPNGDEMDFPDGTATFTKGLAHADDGLPVNDAGQVADFMTRMSSDDPAEIDGVQLSAMADRKFVSPKAGHARELVGGDFDHYCIPPAPKFSSGEEVAEIVENYWMARLRDVPFDQYAGHPLALQAVADLQAVVNAAGAFQGPTPSIGTLFRGTTFGEATGPYLSQFMLLPTPYGAERIDRKMRTLVPGIDHMTSWGTWLAVQNGIRPPAPGYDPTVRYMRNGRDLSEWVHIDALYQAYFMACLILLGYTTPAGAPAFAPTLPYQNGSPANQEPFATFGGPHILALVTEVSTRALKAVWRQKWRVHRRLRPEVFAARIHQDRVRGANNNRFGIDYATLDQAANLAAWASARNSWLLPMAFPEGSPLHPAYGAGHATVAGACTTILKAWFDGSKELVKLMDPFTGQPLKPVKAAADGLSLVTDGVADAGQLTIEGELNKVAANIGIGRNVAGVHWRSDHTASLALGERVAIHTLLDYAGCYAESGVELRFRSFGGQNIVVSNGSVTPANYAGADCMAAAAEIAALGGRRSGPAVPATLPPVSIAAE